MLVKLYVAIIQDSVKVNFFTAHKHQLRDIQIQRNKKYKLFKLKIYGDFNKVYRIVKTILCNCKARLRLTI